jgi:hypothetical protein
MVAEVLKTTDDSLSAFPRAWRQADAAPNTAQLAESDVTKAAPTSKQLGAHPSQDIAMVRIPGFRVISKFIHSKAVLASKQLGAQPSQGIASVSPHFD